METNPNISEQVLEKIRSGEISMRPKFYFMLQIAAVAVLSAIIFLLSLFVLSFIFFSIHESGEQFLLGFGGRGIQIFFSLFPWLSFALVIALTIGLEFLLRRFRFGYRISLLRIFLAIAGIVVAASLVLAVTPFHASLLDRADHDRLPLVGGMYEQIHDSHADLGVFRGQVTDIASSSFRLGHNDRDRDADDGSWIVIPPSGFNFSSLSPGTQVYVAGDAHDGIIRAYGIREESPR